MIRPNTIGENILRVQERIARAREKAARGDEITLIAASKTQPAEAIRAAYEAGVRHFGENRVQEWEGKRGLLGDLQASWHLIGHLQSNKAGRAAKVFHCVDSADDFDVAERLDRAWGELKVARKLRILIEVRVADEADFAASVHRNRCYFFCEQWPATSFHAPAWLAQVSVQITERWRCWPW